MRRHQKRSFIFKSSIRTVFNRPIETKLVVQNYRVFAVFDLEGSHRLAFEITTDSLPTTNEPKSLPAYVPFHKAEAFVRKINDRRMRFEGTLTRLSVILGIFPVLCFLLAQTTKIVEAAVPYVLVGGWIVGAFFLYH